METRATLFRNEDGAMFAESVIMLPVIIMLWALTNFVQEGFSEASRAGRNVRHAAWTTSTNQCEDDPDDVDFSDGTHIDAEAAALALVTAAAGRQIATQIPRTSAAFLLAGGGYFNLLSFRQDEHIYGQRGDIDRPYLGGQARFGSQMTLRCDEDPPEAEDDQAARIAMAYNLDIRRRL